MLGIKYSSSIFVFIVMASFPGSSLLFKIEQIGKNQKLNQTSELYLKHSIIKEVNNIGAPTKLSNCKAKLDDGSIIDLTSLDNVNSPKYI